MKKKKLIILGIVLMLIFIIIGICAAVFFTYKEITNNISLETDKYLTSIEVDSKNNFILYIDKNKKISNIIFLNYDSVSNLYKKNIEGKNIKNGIRLIVENINNDGIGEDDFNLINYGNREIYGKIKKEFEKSFSTYGITKEIKELSSTTIEEKAMNISGKRIKSRDESLKYLYNTSINIISKSISHKRITYSEEQFDNFSINVYKKLENYAKSINNQGKDDKTLDITTINATNNYKNPMFLSIDSWYYIENGYVYSYMVFNYNNKKYEYCYKGNENLLKGACENQ